ncbi:hypothetical protein BLOT_016770 [Blomia tropicalis]|nr:hypothetical protein BLOT_016770 [Blomia tropicalis]
MNVLKTFGFSILNQWTLLSESIITRCSEYRFIRTKPIQKVRIGLLRIMFYLYLLIAIIRFLFSGYCLAKLIFMNYFDYDVLMGIGIKIKLYARDTAFAVAPFPIFVWYFDYEVNVRKYNYVWRIVHDLMVNNCRDFFQLNPHFRPTINLLCPINTLKKWKTILVMFNKPETNPVSLQFKNRKLKYYPSLIPNSRLRFIFRNYLMITFNSIFIVGTKLDYYLRRALKRTLMGRWTPKQLSQQLDSFCSISNFTFNIYLISALYFLPMALGEQIICFALIILQILFTSVALFPVISLTDCIHHSALAFQDAQYCINGTNYLRKKLKLMTYFEFMHTTNQINFTLGPIGKIKKESLIEFMFIYTGNLMFIFSMLQTSELRKNTEIALN